MFPTSLLPIEKEDIPRLHFIHHEVLPAGHAIDRRRQALFQAMILGNKHHGKVRITFETAEGWFQVETTVWAAMEDYVLLKGGVYIPARCIHDVDIP